MLFFFNLKVVQKTKNSITKKKFFSSFLKQNVSDNDQIPKYTSPKMCLTEIRFNLLHHITKL